MHGTGRRSRKCARINQQQRQQHSSNSTVLPGHRRRSIAKFTSVRVPMGKKWDRFKKFFCKNTDDAVEDSTSSQGSKPQPAAPALPASAAAHDASRTERARAMHAADDETKISVAADSSAVPAGNDLTTSLLTSTAVDIGAYDCEIKIPSLARFHLGWEVRTSKRHAQPESANFNVCALIGVTGFRNTGKTWLLRKLLSLPALARQQDTGKFGTR